MSVKRLQHIPGFSIDEVAHAAGQDPEVLRLENLDTDIPPPPQAIAATRAAIGRDADNSYLPFTGQEALRNEIARQLNGHYGTGYSQRQVVITCGATEAMLDILLATTDPGDEVVLTDPTYAGMINRVRLVGAVPRLLPFVQRQGSWELDLQQLPAVVNGRTRAFFIMNPSMPSGAVLSAEAWEQICRLCVARAYWLIYNAAMESLLFDGRSLIHPLAYPGMQHRCIVVGSVSKIYRMIGWRVGWAVAPVPLIDDIARVHIYNAVTPTGIAQAGALAALQSSEADFRKYLGELERRRNTLNEQLAAYSMIPAAGGWSQLLDVSPLGLDGEQASRLLLEKGKVAATPMTHWGHLHSRQYIRLVFSNEPVSRLKSLRERFKRSFG